MNDTQIVDLLRAVGFTLVVLDWTTPIAGLATPSVVLLAGSLVYQFLRWTRVRSAHKRLKRQVESLRPVGGDQ